MRNLGFVPAPHLIRRWIFLSVIISLSVITTGAQTVSGLTIEEAYRLARKNYPLIRQQDLIAKTKQYTVDNAAKGYLPALSVSGLVTYQSAVTQYPAPGFPTFKKDQYKFYAELDQLIYDGGQIKNQKEAAGVNDVIQQQSLEVELYTLYDRVDQLFFGALLEDDQIHLNDLLKKDLQNGIDRAKAQVANGTAYRSSVDVLVAQLLQADQSRIELLANRKAFTDMLGLFIGRVLDDNTVLEQPPVPQLATNVSRPELLYYDYQKRAYDLQDDELKVQLRPKLGFFVQGGLARPGLNFLSDNFSWYYYGGVRLIWNLGSLYTLKNNRNLSDIGRQNLEVEKQTFLLNTQITQKQKSSELQKYIELVKNDDEIVSLRDAVKKASTAQLENGVLSARDYITEVNAEAQARQSRSLHEVQLLQVRYSYQALMGATSIK